MGNAPAISVVLPTHNGIRYLDESIESIVAQTHKNWDLIIVDDASMDDTPAKIASWVARDKRIHAVRLQRNRKLPGALNEGFRRVSGSFLTWTSDDNRYHPEAFARMLAVIEKEPEVGVVYAGGALIDGEGSFVDVYEVGEPEELALRNCVGACFLYRRAVQEKLRCYDEELFLAEDYDFWLRASNEFRLKPLHEPLYFYRLHEASLSARKQREIMFARERAIERWLPQATWLNREKRIEACWALSCDALCVGVPSVGRRWFLRAMFAARRPVLFPRNRSYLVDLLLGIRVGRLVRLLGRRIRAIGKA